MMTENKTLDPVVHIVVLNYKNYTDTNRCLDSLARIDYSNYKILVVDNDSGNNSLGHIANHLDSLGVLYDRHEVPPERTRDGPRIHLIQSGGNRGYAAGNNVGITIALAEDADYIAILNNDTIVPRDFPSKLVSFADSDSIIGIVGPKVIGSNGQVQPSCARRRTGFWDNLFVFGLMGRFFPNNPWRTSYFYTNSYNYNVPKRVDLVAGCCMLIRSEVFKMIGLMDENTFLMCEEHILAEKLRKTKFITYIYPDLTIQHLHGQSIKLESQIWMRKISNKSVYYYLTEYRGYSRFFCESSCNITVETTLALQKHSNPILR
jgi:GT2 family glycosyltransferase